MSSFVGHSLAGMSVALAIGVNQTGRKRRGLVIIVAALAVLPDIDVLVYLTFGALGMTPHRGLTHTLLFATMISSALAAISRSYFAMTFCRAFLLFTGVMLSHLLLDYLMGCGPAVPFFWPLSNHGYLFPYKVAPTAYYGLSATELISLLFYPPAIIGILLEVLIFLPPFSILSHKSTIPR